MSKEYEPTQRAPSRGGDLGSGDDFLGRQREYHPTIPVGEMGSGSYGYGSLAHPDVIKTESLRTEPPSFAWLVIVDGIHAGHIFHLHPDSTLIGRDPGCDIVLDDTAVGRQHAKVRAIEGEDKKKIFVLHDLATENGTFVNGEEIVKQALKDGDRILLGRTNLVFKQVQL